MKCFEAFCKYKVNCNNTECRYLINSTQDNNCALIASSKSTKTLEEVANIYNLTKMRICQIEHTAIQKIKSSLKNFNI